MKIVVSGSSGLIGSAFVREALKNNHEVIKLVRRAPQSPDESQWDPIKGTMDASVLQKTGAVVHLAAAGVGDHRWTKKYKKEILDSRVKSTQTLANAITSINNPPSVFVSASAMGFYGETGDQAVDENTG